MKSLHMDLSKAGSESCPMKEQKGTNDSQNESENEVYNDVGFCFSDFTNQTHHVPGVLSHTTNTHEIAEKVIDGKNYEKIIVMLFYK